MLKLLKLLKELKAQGFATKGDKAQVQSFLKELDTEEQETVADDVAAVDALPEEDPEAEDEQKEIEKGIKNLLAKSVKDISEKSKQELNAAVDAIKAETKTFVEESLKLKEKKSGVYHEDVAEKRVKLNEYLRDLTKALIEGDTAKVKELTTDATGSPYGGYVVDRELSAEIRHLTTEYGVARREFMTIALSKNSYDANALVTDVTVGWVGEGGSIGSTQVVLGQESLTLKKLAAIVTLTRELLEDQEIDLFAFIASRVAEGFALKEDTAFFMGEGSGDTANAEFTGVVFASGANEEEIPVRGSVNGQSFSHLTADDLLNLQDACPQSVAKTGKYYMHRSIRNLVRKLKDDEGAPIYQSPSENGPATIWGRPVVEVEVMPSTADTAADTAFVVYGDLKKSSIFGYRNGLSADRFNAGVVRNVAGNADINLITTDREAIRWVERIGCMHILPNAIAVLKTASGS